MKFFLDSAKLNEIEHALEMWGIDGVTTNPRHVQVAGKPFLKTIQEIAELFKGTDKTISVEVNPHLNTPQEMIEEARKLAGLSPNFVIKLQCVEAACPAMRVLTQEGIRVNCTLIFSGMQALQAMRSGAFFISPFIGWKEANAEETFGFLEEVTTMRDLYGFTSEIIVAAVRNARQIVDAATLGADIVTAGFDVYSKGFTHPYTRDGIELFANFWDQTPYE